MNIYDTITNRIIDQLERGVAPWTQPWRGGASGAPANFVSQRNYSGINTLLLGLSGYTSRYWLTYRQAVALGGHVRKGETGTPIVFVSAFDSKTETKRDGTPQRVAFLKTYSVFNVTQCDGVDTAADVPVTPVAPVEAAEAIAAGYDGPSRDLHADRAYYRPATDHVAVPALDRYAKAASYYNTLFHELIHSTGHASRLSRAAVVDVQHFGNALYSREELVAEVGAAFLCATAGLETVAASASYCQSWLTVLKADNRLIVSAASQASAAANYILHRD